jgi:predicted dehydrogenase
MATARKMKCAIIGCGGIGRTHADAYAASPYGELACVVDIIKDKADSLAAAHGVPRAVANYRAVLNDPGIEAVSVCLPNHLHAPVSIACLKAGKHVLCEKPIALNVAQAKAMQAAAHRYRRVLAIGVVNRFSVNVNAIRDMIRQGELGSVYHVQAVFKGHRSIPGLGGWFTTKAKSGGGVMIDWGVHFIDLILYCLGFPQPVSVSGSAYAKLGRDMRNYAYMSMWAGPPNFDGVCDVEEYVSGLVRTRGPSIAFEGAWAQNIGEGAMYIEFLGEKGGVRLQYGGDFTFYSHRNGILYKTQPSIRGGSMFHDEINSFLECCSTGRKSPAHIDAVICTQRILDAFYLSARKHREVAIR